MGDTYKGLNQWSQAIEQYAVRCSFTLAQFHTFCMYHSALRVRPSYHEALNDLVHALQHICDWEQWSVAFNQVEQALARELATGALPLFVKPFHALVYPLEPQHMLLVARAYAARAVRLTKSLQPQPLPIWLLLPRTGHLRLGYVSSNIGDHSLTHLMRSVFRLHGSKLQVHIFALNPSDDSGYRKDLETALGARFHSCSEISGVSCARLVNQQRIHTLCDLVGYTGGGEKANEVFAVRPAAHAWSYMGFCASSGAAYETTRSQPTTGPLLPHASSAGTWMDLLLTLLLRRRSRSSISARSS
jgi:protein O-GlcNAc transferase